jgi:Rha family phage regulatory protein
MGNLINIVNNEAHTDTLVIAEQFGRRHDNVLRTIKELTEGGTLGALEIEGTSYIDSQNKLRPMYTLTERGFLIAMPFIGGSKAREGQVRLVDAFMAGRQAANDQAVRPVSIEVEIAEAAARMLRMSDTSKARMLGIIAESKGVDPKFLPSYVQEDLTKALSDLLKEHGSALSARAANLLLIDWGILEELERRSTGTQVKKFKSITNTGLEYGRNETSMQNPNETQPRYYVSKFPELLALIEQHDEGA